MTARRALSTSSCCEVREVACEKGVVVWQTVSLGRPHTSGVAAWASTVRHGVDGAGWRWNLGDANSRLAGVHGFNVHGRAWDWTGAVGQPQAMRGT